MLNWSTFLKWVIQSLFCFSNIFSSCSRLNKDPPQISFKKKEKGGIKPDNKIVRSLLKKRSPETPRLNKQVSFAVGTGTRGELAHERR